MSADFSVRFTPGMSKAAQWRDVDVEREKAAKERRCLPVMMMMLMLLLLYLFTIKQTELSHGGIYIITQFIMDIGRD